MKYNTNKAYVVLFCVTDKTIKKTESVSAIKAWASENGVTNVVTEKTLDAKAEQDVMISVDGKDVFALCYPRDLKTYFGLGYADDCLGEYKGNGVSLYEEGTMLAIYIAIGKSEGVVEYNVI